MTPDIGLFSLLLAFFFALIQGVAPSLSPRAVVGQFFCLSLSMFCLIICFLTNDVTVVYVQEHSHALLPFIYRIGAAWGGHEGSLLLWCLILSGWTLLFRMVGKRHLTDSFFTKVLMILGWISAGFILFLLATSNPFARFFPTELITGDDLTPLLQDPGLLFHPPMLYFGYVGFAVGFSFAIAALLEKKCDATWIHAIKPWIILPWALLGCGIVIGSWWAYRELGWGGWWAWDPVENASLLPWLTATALIHCLILAEKRDAFKGWILFLPILTFTLSLLGTFLVRSGVLVSVHTFANDPKRGIYLLIYLSVIISGAFTLYAARIKYFYQAPFFQFMSRETSLLLNSIILLTAVATILIGTLYPILLDALHLGNISVGEPYFNLVFIPIMLPWLFLMGLAPYLHWKKTTTSYLFKKMVSPIFLSLTLAWIIPTLSGCHFHPLAYTGIALSFWVIIATLRYAKKITLTLPRYSMIIAHIGIAIMVLGITITKSYSEEKQVRIILHDTVDLAGYQFTLNQLQNVAGDNYHSIEATFLIREPNQTVFVLSAEQRVFVSHEQTMSKPGVAYNVWRDLYVALGAPLSDNAWSVRLYYKPAVRWIWFGGGLALIGGLLSLLSFSRKRSGA